MVENFAMLTMVFSRAQREQIFSHLILNVLREPTDKPSRLMNALQAHGIDDYHLFKATPATVIDQLTEADEHGRPTTRRLRLGDRSKLNLLHRFVLANDAFDETEWLAVDADDLIDFRLSMAAPSGTATTTMTSNTLTKPQALPKAVKCATSACSVFADDKMSMPSHGNPNDVAHIQQVQTVQDPTFVPTRDYDSVNLYNYPQECMYSTPATQLQPDQGHTFTKHSSDHDAQSVCHTYTKTQTTSIAADNDMHRISESLTTQMWSTKWSGTVTQFALSSKEHLSCYQDLADLNASMPPTRYDAAYAPRSGRIYEFVNLSDIDLSPEHEIAFVDGGEDDEDLWSSDDEDLWSSAWSTEPNNLPTYSHQNLSNFAQDSNANSHFDAYQALLKQQWVPFRAQQQRHDPNFIPGSVWRQISSWTRTALPERDPDERALIAAQTPESDLRKVAYTDRCKLTLADQSKPSTFSSEPLEHELSKWILEHDLRESVTTDQASDNNQYRMQCSYLVHEGKASKYPSSDAQSRIPSSHLAQVRDRNICQGRTAPKNGEIITIEGRQDVHITEYTAMVTSETSIPDLQVDVLKVRTVASTIQTSHGHVAVVPREYAIFGKGKPIHYAAQTKCFDVMEDRLAKVEGTQQLNTCEGHVTPSKFESVLPYLATCPPNVLGLEFYPTST